MLFGRRKPGYTTTVDGSVDPEQAVLELQKAELAAKKKPKAEVFDIDAASETARRLKETGSTFDGSAVTKQTDIVVFETLYRDGVEIAAHADIEDGGQTVTLIPPKPDIPQTGDNSNLGFWIGLGSVALGGVIACIIMYCKRKKDEDE